MIIDRTAEALEAFNKAKEIAVFDGERLTNEVDVKGVLLNIAVSSIHETSERCRGASDGFGESDCWRVITSLKRWGSWLDREDAKIFLEIMNFCLEHFELKEFERGDIEANRKNILEHYTHLHIV